MCHEHIGPGQEDHPNNNMFCLACHEYYNRPGPGNNYSEGDRDETSDTSDGSCVNSLVDSSDDEPDVKTSVLFSDEVVLHTFPILPGCTSGGVLWRGGAVIVSAS